MADHLPLVSVIIPAYNAEKYIKETVESALAQTWPAKEIIVVNDGSTDRTAKILRSFDHQIIVINQVNHGAGAARNTGIQAAQGEYFAFLDSDDLWDPHFLEVHIKNHAANPGLDITYCWWNYIDGNGHLLPESDRYYEQGNLLEQLVITNRFGPIVGMAKKEALEKVGNFDEALTNTEDWDFWLRAAIHGCQFGCIPVVLASYRIHGSNKSSNVARMQKSQLLILDKVFNQPSILHTIMPIKTRAYARVHLDASMGFFRINQPETASGSFIEAVRTWPELLCQESTYYSLICANQPPGYRATQSYIDLDQASQRIRDLLAEVQKDPLASAHYKSHEKRVQALVNLSLAKHYYLANENRKAKQLIGQAWAVYLPSILDTRFMGYWLRASIGHATIQKIKTWIKAPALWIRQARKKIGVN